MTEGRHRTYNLGKIGQFRFLLRTAEGEGGKQMKERSIINKTPLFIILLTVLISAGYAFADADKIFKENSKAVVVIETYNEKGEPIGQGSGFIVRADGVIVTNYHVVSDAADIKVKAGKEVLNVEGLIYTDKENDLVMLKVKGKDLPAVKLGDIEKANVGEKVYVISSPQGFENTISDGILSGIREIAPGRKVLQITAPVSQGSSGGPVFDKNGEVIGIATFLIKEAQNLNFAMPVNIIKDKIHSKKVIALKDSKIEGYEDTAEYWFVLGYYLGEAGMHKEAIEAYRQAIRIKPDYAVAHYNLGVAYGKSGMYREGIEALKQAIRIEPDHAKAHYSLGVAYGKSGMQKESIEAYKQAIRIKPDLAEAHNNLGVAYGKSGMYKEEIEAYKQAIRIKPDYAKAHYNLGVTYLVIDGRGMALEEYKILKELDPQRAEELFNLIYK